MTLTYEQVTDLLPAYAIGALEAEEEEAVEEYVRLQQQLIQNLTRAENATLLMAQGTEHAPLAPDAKERMMARIQADVPEFAKSVGKQDSTDGTTDSLNSNSSHSNSRNGNAINAAASRVANGAVTPPRPVPDATRMRPGNQGRVIQARGPRGGRSRMQQPRRGAARPVRGPRPPELSPPQPKRSFFGGLFNARAMTNATMAASLVTLIFMTLLNLQGEAQFRQASADLLASRAKLNQIEGQIDNLTQSNFALSNSNSELVTQSSRVAEDQITLRAENEQFAASQVQLKADLAALEAENETIAIERATLFEDNARLQTQLDSINERITLVGAATQAVVMFGTEEAPGLQGTFFHRDQEGALVIHGLDPLPPDQAYQFWLVAENGDQVSAGLFAVSAEQEPTWANLELPDDVPQYTVVGISIEPSEGSDSPTGPMLLESGLEVVPPPNTLG